MHGLQNFKYRNDVGQRYQTNFFFNFNGGLLNIETTRVRRFCDVVKDLRFFQVLDSYFGHRIRCEILQLTAKIESNMRSPITHLHHDRSHPVYNSFQTYECFQQYETRNRLTNRQTFKVLSVTLTEIMRVAIVCCYRRWWFSITYSGRRFYVVQVSGWLLKLRVAFRAAVRR
jgi:abortive infection bacteriophage resistance protein